MGAYVGPLGPLGPTYSINYSCRAAHRPTAAGRRPPDTLRGALCGPGDPRGIEEWRATPGMSGRTLDRRFDEEVGMSMRAGETGFEVSAPRDRKWD
jgi:hypothetical protein